MAFEPHSGTKRKLSHEDEDVDLVEEQLNPSKRPTGFQRPQNNDVPFDLNPDPNSDSSSDSEYEFTFCNDEEQDGDEEHFNPINENLNNIKILHKTKNNKKTLQSINENENDNNNNNEDEDIDVVNSF
eukprot:381035_1